MISKHLTLKCTVLLLAVIALPVLLMADSSAGRHKDRAKKHNELLRRRAEDEFRRRAFPLDTIPAGAREKALAQTKAADSSGPKLPGVYTWQAIGPAPIALPLDPASPRSGRVTCVAVDPVNNFHWLLGSAQGGIWETYNAGGTWTPKTDDQASLAIGAIA